MTDTHIFIAFFLCAAIGAGFVGSLLGEALLAILRWRNVLPPRKTEVVIRHVLVDGTEEIEERGDA